MLKIGMSYRVKTWEQLERTVQGKYWDGDLDFGPILFIDEMRDLCGTKLIIASRNNDGVYRVVGEHYSFTENMFIKSKLGELIEVRNEIQSRRYSTDSSMG